MSIRANNLDPSRENSEEKSFLYHKQNSGRRVSDTSNGRFEYGGRRVQPPRRPGLMSRPITLLKHFAGEIARALCMVTGNRRSSQNSAKKSLPPRSKLFVAPLDSHRVEALEDCIQFINSSCTLSRSNSTANS